MYFIACDLCGALFGGPNAGDYDPDEFAKGDNQIFAMLEEEAMSLFWIQVQFGAVRGLMCSPACVNAWLAQESKN
jgi:hypothetical protein